MTIHSFSELQKKYFPNCIDYIPLEHFRGKKIAIDMGMLMHVMFKLVSARMIDSTKVRFEEVNKPAVYSWALGLIVNKLKVFLQYGITPVCCFDSKPHDLKIETARKRKEDEMKRKTEKNKGVIQVEISLEQLKMMLSQSDPLLGDKGLEEMYKDALKKNMHLDHEFVACVEEILDSLSIPKIHAKDIKLVTNDAEGIGAMLCIDGNNICAAIYSEDSDCSVYGCPLTILEIEEQRIVMNGQKVDTHVAKVRNLHKILNEIQLPFPAFVDLCILMGTDFNLNGKQCGPTNSYKYIKQYGCLENVARVIDLSHINYMEVRRIFTSTLIKPPALNLEFNKNTCRNNLSAIFTKHGIEKYIPAYLAILQNFN